MSTSSSDRPAGHGSYANGPGQPGFPAWLAERLRDEGLSQTEAARRVGVTFRTLNRWVKGQSEPKLGQLRAICRVLGTPPIC